MRSSRSLYENDHVFVMWDWIWVDELSSDEGDESVESHNEDDEEPDTSQMILYWQLHILLSSSV